MTEIESVDALEAHVAARGHLMGTVIQGLDLESHAKLLAGAGVSGAVFLGCRLTPSTLGQVLMRGAIVFPRLSGLPYHPYRSRLYTPAELMEGYVRGDPGTFHTSTLDARIYDHYRRAAAGPGPVPIVEALGQRLHDHAMDDALHDLLAGQGAPLEVVGIMGGHAMRRSEPMFREVARLGRGLARAGSTVVTGGGPGAMEAANLGAWMGRASDDAALDEAVSILSRAPQYRDPAWLDRAYEVLERWPDGGPGLSVPTWFYGHEPTNLFATHVAKYFSNSLREDGLLAIARHGMVFAPGSAGTVQEVFQDAAQNHYTTFHVQSPMVFLGVDFWTRERPAYPLLRALAAGRPYADLLAITDDVGEALDFVLSHPPVAG